MTNARVLIRLVLPAILLAAPVFCASATPTGATFAAFTAAAQKKAPSGFTVVAQPPFVVVGDESADKVRTRAVLTVKWAVDKLKQDYFTNDPAETITIWLFQDKASYDKHTWLLFRDRPTTPFGYYSPAHRALIIENGTRSRRRPSARRCANGARKTA